MSKKKRHSAGPPTRRPPGTSSGPWSTWLLVAAAFCIKLVVLLQLHDHPLLQPRGELDPGYYVSIATRVAGGDLLAGSRPFFVSPLYIYFLGLVFALTGGSVLAAQVAQVALGAASVGLVCRTAQVWFGDRVALIAGVLAALTGYFTFNEVLVLQSSLDPFLTALGLWALSRAWLTLRRTSVVWAGAAVGLHALNRPNVLAFALAAVLLSAWVGAARRDEHESESTMRRRALRAALLFACGVALAVLPVVARNVAVARDFTVVASHGGLNFYIGNRAEADGTYRAVPGITPSIVGQDRDARRIAEERVGRPLSDREVSSFFYERAWAWITAHPRQALSLLARKVGYTFNAIDLSLNYSYAYYSHDEPTALRALFVGPWLLLPLGVFGLVLVPPWRELEPGHRVSNDRGARRAWWSVAAFVPIYALTVAAFFVSGRYRQPLLVPLCVTASAGGVWLLRQARLRNARPVLSGTAMLLVLAVLTNRAAGLDDGRAAERTEMILSLIDRGRGDEADALIASTERMHPDPALLLYRAAREYVARGAPARAVSLLERAYALQPRRGEIRLALGQALLDGGRPDEAVAHLRAAAQSGVRNDLAAFDLARALQATGKREEARAALATIPSPERLDPASQLAVGRLALDLGDTAMAIACLQRAAAAMPGDGAAHEALGLATGMEGRKNDAIALLEQACRLDPASASARLNLAVLYAEAGRRDDAIAQATEALRLRPGYPQAQALIESLRQSVAW